MQSLVLIDKCACEQQTVSHSASMQMNPPLVVLPEDGTSCLIASLVPLPSVQYHLALSSFRLFSRLALSASSYYTPLSLFSSSVSVCLWTILYSCQPQPRPPPPFLCIPRPPSLSFPLFLLHSSFCLLICSRDSSLPSQRQLFSSSV